jgi:hypothetical protein
LSDAYYRHVVETIFYGAFFKTFRSYPIRSKSLVVIRSSQHDHHVVRVLVRQRHVRVHVPECRGDREPGEFPEQRDLRRGEHAASHHLLHRGKRAVRRRPAVFVHHVYPHRALHDLGLDVEGVAFPSPLDEHFQPAAVLHLAVPRVAVRVHELPVEQVVRVLELEHDDPARRQTLRRAAKARLRVLGRRQVRRRAEQHGHDVEPREAANRRSNGRQSVCLRRDASEPTFEPFV